MLSSEIEPIKWSLNTNYQLIHSKINIVAENDAQIPLYNLSAYQGMIFNTIEDFDAQVSYRYHLNHNIKPWSFSLLKMKKYEKTDTRGVYSIKKGTHGYWILNTIDSKAFEAFLKTHKRDTHLNLNSLKLKIKSIEYENKTYQSFPEKEFKTITIQLHTPTYFYRANTKEILPFTEETFLESQLRKLQSLNLITSFDVIRLRPFIRIIRDDTSNKYLSMTIGDQIFRGYGSIGYITFKLSGEINVKELLWELFHISQFTGIGTRSSMGFGHNSIISIK